MVLPGAIATGMVITFLFGTGAAVCFALAALGPLGPRQRAGVALVGVVVDWAPVVAGWMTISARPSAVLYAIHVGFGVVGYGLLGYCLLRWLRARPVRFRVRAAFVVVWTPAYVAGVLMAAWTTGG